MPTLQVSAPVQKRPSSHSAFTEQETQAGTEVAFGAASIPPTTASQPGLPGPATQPHQLFSKSSVGVAPLMAPAASLPTIALLPNDTVEPAGRPP